MARRSRKKNPERVLAELSMAGTEQPSVTLNAASQASLLSFTLNRKISVLMKARNRFVDALQHNPPSPAVLLAELQRIDAEVNLCIAILNSIANNTPIQFPTAQQIAALSAAVQALGTATAQGAAINALIPAVANVIATFPG